MKHGDQHRRVTKTNIEMKSKILVDLSEDNSPVIKVTVVDNDEDLRDKLLKRFFEDLGHKSMWLKVKPTYFVGSERELKIWEVRPIKPIDIIIEAASMIHFSNFKTDQDGNIDSKTKDNLSELAIKMRTWLTLYSKHVDENPTERMVELVGQLEGAKATSFTTRHNPSTPFTLTGDADMKTTE